ncbi:alpha/beta hydrolase [Lentzea sp. NPDC006480]|uniref:alpha/beta hydrolase family protein n=1 Tax=Lentzea sp. NPDC006480 TaxID=3157176 RepID=UPI0033B2E293
MRRWAYGTAAQQFVEVSGSGDLGVVLVHGGFWRAEKTVDSLHPVVEDLAGHGLVVGNAEYRTVDHGHEWPACLDDVVEATRCFGRATGVPLTRTVLIGHSAGGQLALLAARSLPGLGGVVGLAALADLETAAADDLGEGAVAALGAEPAAVSPLRHPADTKVVLVHGDADQTVPFAQSESYAAAWSARLVAVPGARHMHLVKPERPAWPVVRAEILSLTEELSRG